MNNILLEKYADLKSLISDLQDQESILKEEILVDFKNNKLEKIESEYGKFTVAKRKNYKYSDKVVAMEEKVKLAKNKEVEKGTAKASITSYLLWTENMELTPDELKDLTFEKLQEEAEDRDESFNNFNGDEYYD